LNNPLKRLFDRTPQYFIKILRISSDWTVIDFGCGPGFFTIPFAMVAGRVVGVDVQAEMIDKAENYARKARVRAGFIQSDGTTIGLPDESLDLVFLNLVYHEIEEKKATLSEFRRLLRPGGMVAVREKTENTLLPMGPPILPVDLIRSGLEDAGFREIHSIGRRGRRIIAGVKPSGPIRLR
jgi:ubiquinone/menaquinone biosynthesis C-methylase UbiE